jgi:hypothetical protein
MWGHSPVLRSEADRFCWTIARRAFGIGKSIPVRAISSELALEPAVVVYEARRSNLVLREERWGILAGIRGYRGMDSGLGVAKLVGIERGEFGVGIRIRPVLSPDSAKVGLMEDMSAARETEVIVMTDGSCKNGKAAGAAIFYKGGLSSPILLVTETCAYEATADEAKFLAIILALENFGRIHHVTNCRIYSDSAFAIDA